MNIVLNNISEQEFESLFLFLAGYQLMGNKDQPDKALAKKLYGQLIPVAKKVYGFEFEKIMAKLKDFDKILPGLNIVVEKHYPPGDGRN